jgi:hypothetical protein
VAEAKGMLSRRFGHWSWSSTGVLDQMLHRFEADQRKTGIGFEAWLAEGYDPAVITAEFDAMSLRARIRQTWG